MAIYRGIGGAGDSTTDATITAVTQQATNAAASATSASTSASSASASATAAASSASAAATSETNAATSETNAATSETNAAASASAASTSETNAAISETNAAASESAVAASASAASTSETNAAASETAAAASETAAAASASSASTSASNAATSASSAATSATAASNAQTAAEAAQAAAEAAQEAIDGLYLGAQASDPTLDLNGDPVTAGDWYYNTNTNVTRIYDGAVWNNGAVSTAGFLLAGNNLSDVTNAATVRTNLGLGTTDTPTFSGAIVSANSSTDAVTITQTGTGKALVVEDSTSPDSTPFVIDASGRVIKGYTTSVPSLGVTNTPDISVFGNSASNNGFGNYSYTASASASFFNFAKSRSTLPGTPSIVLENDDLGYIKFNGDDGTQFIEAARIWAEVDGTPGTNDMPGRLVFSTTADGASSPTERMRITSATSENILFGLTASQGAGRVQSIGDSATAAYLAYSSSTSQREAFRFVNGNGEIASFGMNGTSLTTRVGGTERMRIDSAGLVTYTGSAYYGANPWRIYGAGNRGSVQISQPFSAGEFDNANRPVSFGNNIYLDEALTWQRQATDIGGSAIVLGSNNGTSGSINFYTANDPDVSSAVDLRMRIDSSGNVGIGMSSPAYLLHLAASSTTEGPQIRLQNTNSGIVAGGTAGVIDFYANDTSTGGTGISGFIKNVFENAGVLSALTFGTRTADNAVERVRITSSGDVGIGTSSPASPLDVAGKGFFRGTGSFEALELVTSDANRVYVTGNSSVTGDMWRIGTSASNPNLNIDALQANGEILLRTGGTNERLRIDSSGHIIVPNGVTLGTAAGTYNADNTLDDYEEGTWTPTLTSSGTAPTISLYQNRVGTYTKIGNQVTIFCNLRINVTSAGTGYPKVTGLPFSADGSTLPGPSHGIYNAFTSTSLGNSYINVNEVLFSENAIKVVTGGYVTFSLTYTTA